MLIFDLTKHLSTSGNCILNILRTDYIIHYIIQVTYKKIFFNHKWKFNIFNSVFNVDLKLHVILNSFSTEKTVLIHEIVINKGNFKSLFLNYYLEQFDFLKNLYNSISMQFKPFFKKWKELLKKILLEIDLKTKFSYFFELNFKLFNKKEKEITSNNVSELLIEIAYILLKWNIWHDDYALPSILIIDEVNLLN